jgi:hypothetical protein
MPFSAQCRQRGHYEEEFILETLASMGGRFARARLGDIAD